MNTTYVIKGKYDVDIVALVYLKHDKQCVCYFIDGKKFKDLIQAEEYIDINYSI